GKADRHTIANACTRGYLCRGWKLMYEDDWSPLGDYRYKPTPGRNLDGSLKPGHTMSPIYAARQSAETRKMRSDKARELCRRLNATPGSNWGRYLDKRKPVECLTTGERFASIGEAAARYNLPQNYISSAISRNGTVHGLKFQKI
ncbi:hypothetical protein, partial [Prevotella sp. KH2C16]|uniref:hypothetical protein n=1 Tax=Prevotella sp. KH2C16 TaxID=1855325 RepID=UPI0008EB4153